MKKQWLILAVLLCIPVGNPAIAQTAEETVAYLVFGLDEGVVQNVKKKHYGYNIIEVEGAESASRLKESPAQYKRKYRGTKSIASGVVILQTEELLEIQKLSDCKYSFTVSYNRIYRHEPHDNKYASNEEKKDQSVSGDVDFSKLTKPLRIVDGETDKSGDGVRIVGDPANWCVIGDKKMPCQIDVSTRIDRARWANAYNFLQTTICKVAPSAKRAF